MGAVHGGQVEVNEMSETDGHAHDPNRMQAGTARDVLEYVVRNLVDEPDAVGIDVVDKAKRVGLNVHVGSGDMGRVIGRRGRVANSIRTVVRAAAARDEVEVDVEFVD